MKVYSTNPATVSRRQWYMRNRERCNALRRELYRANPHKIRAQRAVGGNVLPRILAIACLLVCWSASAFAQFGSNTARRIFSGTAAPQATCNAGPVDVYVRTGGVSAGLYLCLSTNTWTGPLSAGGGGTINANNGSAGAGVFYPAAAGSTTVGPLSGLTYDSVGDATLAQGTITTSNPFYQHTVTWNAGGVAFTNWISNITCTAAATGSFALKLGVGGTDWQFKYTSANCATPQLLGPDGASSTPAFSFVSQPGSGMATVGGGGELAWSTATQANARLGTTGGNKAFYVASGIGIGFASGTNVTVAGPDTMFSRAAAGSLSEDTSTPSNGLGGLTNCRTIVNVTPVTVNANVSIDQNLMAATIPANCLSTVGRTVRIWVAGVYSTPAASTSAIRIKVLLCSVSGCGSGNIATLINIVSTAIGTLQVTNNAFNLTAWSTTQTAGAASRSEAHGVFSIDLGASNATADSVFNDVNQATIAGSPSDIDFTAQNFLQVTIAASSASGSNSFIQRQMVLDSVN